MSKHTPGPWKFEKDGSIEHNNVENYIDGADGTLIVYGHVKDADARLIAAAPDLLEALHAMCEYTAELNPNQGFDGHDADAVNKARAAIAKAEASK